MPVCPPIHEKRFVSGIPSTASGMVAVRFTHTIPQTHERGRSGGNRMEEPQARPIAALLKENRAYLKTMLGIGTSFDIIEKEFHFDDTVVVCYCVNGFFLTNVNILLVRSVAEQVANFAKSQASQDPRDLLQYLNTHITFVQVAMVESMEDALLQILSGPMVLFAEGYRVAIVVDTRVYPGRTPSEPTTERVVRGPRDGFTEILLTNTALTRRRLRDPKLRMEILQVGRRSKTDVCIAYIEDITNPDMVNEVREKLRSIRVDGIPMAEQSLDEFLMGSRWNPYPLIRYTERPDVVAIHLLQGHIAVFVDTTPEVIILPTTFFHHLHHPQDYHLRPMVGTYMRWIILFAIFLSIFLPATWLEMATHPSSLPKWLRFIGDVDKSGHVSLPWQLILVEIGIDMLRRAIINTPLPVASAIGLIAGIVFGQLSIKVGLVSSEALVYMALATIGSFATASPELSNANRITRIFLLVLVGTFHIYGLIAGIILWFVVLGRTKTFGIPYLWPLIPFNWRGLRRILIREPVSEENTRPDILKPSDKTKK
jgi:stage V sporulation protein AF